VHLPPPRWSRDDVDDDTAVDARHWAVDRWLPTSRSPIVLSVGDTRFNRPRVGLSDPGARRAFAELLIDCEEDRTLRAVLVDMLREGDERC
jgi:hypothetical protein